MLSYGAIDLQIPSLDEANWINANIPVETAFSFFRHRWLGDPALNPRAHFAWFLSRPMRINSFFYPWGASRWGYVFILADKNMHFDIIDQNENGEALPFVMSDGLGSSITTDLFMLPPVPLSKIKNVNPSLPLFLIPLVDLRYFWWERADGIEVTQGTTTWEEVYEEIATGLDVTITVDPISDDYLDPGQGLTKQYQHLPLLLDWVASSVGQRIVRTLDGAFHARSATTANGLMIAQANAFKKYAGGSLSFGVVDA